MNTIEIWVPGEPKAQPRARAFSFAGRVRVYDPGTAESWKSQVAGAAKEHRPSSPLAGPVRLHLIFFMPRPRAHFGSGRNHDRIKDSSPLYHTTKPDCDNLAKAVMDALSILGFWKDDKQVASLETSKFYGEQPGCSIMIKPLPESHVEQ